MATFPGGRGSKWSLRSTQEEQRGLNRRQDRQFMIDLGKSILDLGATMGVEYAKYEHLGGKEATQAKSYEALAKGTEAGAKMKEAGAQVTRADAYAASSKAASDLAVKQLAADVASGKEQRISAAAIAKLQADAQVDAAAANQRGSQALAAAQTKVAQIQADVSLNTQDKAQLEKKVAVAVATRNSLSKYKEGSPAWQRVFKNFTNQVLSLDNLADKITGRSTAVDIPPVGAQTTTSRTPTTPGATLQSSLEELGVPKSVAKAPANDPVFLKRFEEAGAVMLTGLGPSHRLKLSGKTYTVEELVKKMRGLEPMDIQTFLTSVVDDIKRDSTSDGGAILNALIRAISDSKRGKPPGRDWTI